MSQRQAVRARARALDPTAYVVDLGAGDVKGAQWCLRLAMSAALFGDAGLGARTVNSAACALLQRVPAAAWPLSGHSHTKTAYMAAHGDDVGLGEAADMYLLSAMCAALDVQALILHGLSSRSPICVGEGSLPVILPFLEDGSHYLAFTHSLSVTTTTVALPPRASDPGAWRKAGTDVSSSGGGSGGAATGGSASAPAKPRRRRGREASAGNGSASDATDAATARGFPAATLL